MCSKNNCCCKKKKTTKAKPRAKPARKAYLPYISPVPNQVQSLMQNIPSAVSQVSLGVEEKPVKKTAEMGTQTESLVEKNLPALKALMKRGRPLKQEPKQELPQMQVIENQVRGRQIVNNVLQKQEERRGYSVIRTARSPTRAPTAKATNVPQFIQSLEKRQPPKKEIIPIQPTPSVKKEQIKRKVGRPKKELVGSILQLEL